MVKSAFQLWKEDQERKKQEAAQGQVRYREAVQTSRPQYTLPQYQGDSKEKNYQWETDMLRDFRGRRVGRSYNDKFATITRRLGMSDTQADEYRRYLDFQEDRNQKIKTNKDGSVRKNQNVRPGQGAMLQSELQDNIFKNMEARMQPVEKKVAFAKVDNWDKVKNLLGVDLSKAKQNTLEAEKLGIKPKNVTESEWKDAQSKATDKAIQDAGNEREGLLGFLDKTLGRVGNAAHKVFGEDFVKAENENYANLAINKLKKHPTDRRALAALQSLNTTTRPAQTKTEKAADFIGRSAGELAPYTFGAYGAADAALNKLGLNAIKSPLAKELIRGIGAGTIAGSEKAALRKTLSNENTDWKNIALEAGLAGGGDAAVGALARNLNLKGQLQKVLEGTSSKKFNQQEFEKALQEAFGQKGNPVNVLASKPKTIPKPFESLYPNVKVQASKVEEATPTIVNFGNHPSIGKMLESLNPYGPETNLLQGTKPQPRMNVGNSKVGRYGREAITQMADDTLNRVEALKNAPEGGFNQRLLEIQQRMKQNHQPVQEYQKEFQDAVKKQYDYLKSSMGKGVESGTTSNGLAGNFKQVTGTYSVSKNPKWYQDFYRLNGRKPNEQELQKLAEDHVLNGFSDEFGNIPSYTPRKIHDIDSQLNEINNLLKQHPNQEHTLKPIAQALEHDRLSIMDNYQKSLNTPSNVDDLYQTVKQSNDPKSFDELVKLAEMEHNRNVSSKNLKNLLKGDPRIAEGIRKLNELGKRTQQDVPVIPEPIKPSNQQKSLSEAIAELNQKYNGHGDQEAYIRDLQNVYANHYPSMEDIKVNNIPKVSASTNPLARLQEVMSSPAKAPMKQGENSLLLSLKNMGKSPLESPIPMADAPVVQKMTKPVTLKSVQTPKSIEQMSKEELQSVYQKLNDDFRTLSKGRKKSTRIQDVQADLETVKNQLLRLDLQSFGEVGKISSELLPDTKSHIGTKTEKSNLGVKDAVNTGYIKTVDNLHRLNQFDKHVEEVLGRKLNASEQTHTLGLNSRGTDMISKQILTEKMVDKNGEAIGNSLKDITMKVPKGKLKDFEDYLINRHAVTRMERGEKVFPDHMNMTPDTSRAIVRNYEEAHPEFKDIAKEYYDYNKQLGQKWLVDTGILSKDQWESYLKANPNYVPNNRIFGDLERPKFMGNAKKGFANQTNPVKKATGSQRKIVSPIESTIEHTAQYVKVAKRNEVMQTLVNNIKQNPEAFKDWAEIVPTDKTPKSIMETIEKEGIDGVLDEFNKGFDQKPDLTKGNILRGLIEGQPVHIKIHDPALLDALTNLQPKAQNVVINAMGQVTRIMKNLTTGINPVFSLTRNIWRDIPTAFANSKSTNNPLVFSKDLVQSVISVFKNDELYQSFKAIGGGHSSPISSDVNLLAQSKRSILPREKGVWNGTKHAGGKLLGALENLNNAVEAAPRLGEFKRIAGNDYDSKMKALFEANDVTVNFNKYGNVAKDVDAIIPYFNAAVQGLDKTWRVFMNGTKAERATAAAKAFSAITIPTILMYTVNHDDPNYQKVSNYVKDTNILIPKGDGTFIKIPKPRELGVLFGSDVERTLRAWADKDPQAFKDFSTTLWDNFKPPVRTIAAPLFDIRANKNFMDAPIVPGDLEGLSPQYQYDSKTSELSKKLGMLVKASPKNIDYLIQSYTGGVGELGLPMMTKNTSVGQTLKQKVTVDPVFSNDIQRDFYNTKTKLDQAHNDLTKQGVKTKDLNEKLRNIFGKKSREMGDIRKDMKKVQNDPNMSAVDRLKKLRELQDEINKIAGSSNKLAR